jgi:tRNA(Ser,Leu) C12 N-acetylase TAN1
MKIKVEYTNDMIKELIIKDMEQKIARTNKVDIDVKVRSKQNYREKDWEIGELKVELELEL